MKFDRLIIKYHETYRRRNDTPEKLFEFETYSIIYTLLDVLYAFETGSRDVLRKYDYNELLKKLEYCHNILKRNINYLETRQK